jgi:Flp pilus assembly pilin Flp
MTLYIYFFLISISLIGYGLFLSYALSITLTDLGNLGILGLITISFISYLTTLFTSHNYIFNSIILVIGLIIFFFFRKKIENFKFQFLIYLIFLILLFLFISIGKNHDDFP